jgi:hypothetical protein
VVCSVVNRVVVVVMLSSDPVKVGRTSVTAPCSVISLSLVTVWLSASFFLDVVGLLFMDVPVVNTVVVVHMVLSTDPVEVGPTSVAGACSVV